MGPISEAFNGQSDSNVGLRAGLTADIWTVVNPNLDPLQAEINRGDQVFEKLMTSLTPAEVRQPQNLAVHPRRAAAGDRRADLAVRHPSVAGQLPADRLAAGHVDLAAAR